VRYEATLESGEDGGYTAQCETLGVAGHGLSPASALDALRAEIRYRVELCPCSSVDDDYVELVVGE
jgi:hypothetical protein